jgi:hypothetical protein
MFPARLRTRSSNSSFSCLKPSDSAVKVAVSYQPSALSYKNGVFLVKDEAIPARFSPPGCRGGSPKTS